MSKIKLKQTKTADFLIVWAGILGLTIASRIQESFPNVKIIVIEKEKMVGLHASGRNSGVMHSGIYYPPDSLKAKLCAHGARLMFDYCKKHNLPYSQLGKIIVPKSEMDHETLHLLYNRGLQNNVQVEVINEQQLRELEPAACSATGEALLVPQTGVVDSQAIVNHLYQTLKAQGVIFLFDQACEFIDTKSKRAKTNRSLISYQHLVNTAGLYADKIAEYCGIKNKYTMLPFKGIYYEMKDCAPIHINHLIYPVPDMNVPFLGVHFTKSIYGKIYVGPTAIPALGREHYRGAKSINVTEAMAVFYHILKQYQLNEQGFRAYAHHEIARFLKPNFIKAAKQLVPELKAEDIILSKKVGIRAQLLNVSSRQLVMDFLIEHTNNETHVLNAVSPAFTSSFSFSNYIVQQIENRIQKAA